MPVRIQLHLPRDARYVGVMRGVASCVLDHLGAPADAAADVQLALSEACANAVRYADASSEYSVALVLEDDRCEIEVRDLGPGFDPAGREGRLAAADTESGRGLYLMRALVDDLQFDRSDEETKVRLVKHWTDPSSMSAPAGRSDAVEERPDPGALRRHSS